MCIKDRPYLYKEVPARTLLVNEAKKCHLTKTKFSSRRQKISSNITNFSFDSSPNLRNIRRHQNNRYAKISPLFRLKRRFAIFLVKIREFRSYLRSSAYTSHLHSTVLSKRCFTYCLFRDYCEDKEKIQTYRHSH